MRQEYDLIRAIVEPLGLSYETTMDRILGDSITTFFVKNQNIFYTDFIYGKILDWVRVYFEPVFLANPALWDKVQNKDKYLTQLIFLIAPTLHVKLFHRGIDAISPRDAISIFLKEIGIKDAEIITASLENKTAEINDRNLLH